MGSDLKFSKRDNEYFFLFEYWSVKLIVNTEKNLRIENMFKSKIFI